MLLDALNTGRRIGWRTTENRRLFVGLALQWAGENCAAATAKAMKKGKCTSARALMLGLGAVPSPRLRPLLHIVTVNVVVTDRNSQPVGGLQAKDFTLLEVGSLSRIQFFEHTGPQRRSRYCSAAVAAPPIHKLRNQDPGGVMNIVLSTR